MHRSLLIIALMLPNLAHADTLQVGPGEDFCSVLATATPGDEVVLMGDSYPGPCTIGTGGVQGMPITLRAADPSVPVSIVYDGVDSNVIDVLASWVVISGLHFGPTNDAIDGVKIKSGDAITVEDCVFEQIGGISISANSADSDGVIVRRNRFVDLHATGLYFGCQDGMSACAATDLTIEGNLFDGVDSAAVGYAMEIKTDSWAYVRDNVIHDTKGPGIEIYGSADLSRVSIVEGNVVIGSREAGTLEIGGGPVIVRNNIVIGGSSAAILVYDYGGQGNVHGIHVLGNTAIGDAGPAIAIGSSWVAGADLELSDNAAWQMAGSGPAVPAPVAGTTMVGNVECTDPATCFVDAAGWDVWPSAGAMLMGATPDAADELTVDFCGQPRAMPPTAGAFEASGENDPGAIAIDFKRNFACPNAGADTTGGSEGGGTVDGGGSSGADSGSAGGSASATSTMTTASGTSAGTGDTSGDAPGQSDGDGGCSCRAASPRSVGDAFLLMAIAGLRRRRPSTRRGSRRGRSRPTS
jgi:hypothetical protein